MTAVAFSGRGIKDLPCYKFPFHGARIADIHLVAKIMKEVCPSSMIVAAGFSMGGIVVCSYASKMGTN